MRRRRRRDDPSGWWALAALVGALVGGALLGALIGGAIGTATRDPYLEDPELSTLGGVILGAPVGAMAGLVLWAVWLSRSSDPGASKPCPRCGREVTVGSPTCLGCGYDFVKFPQRG